jgi:argininosuccinate lyase
MLGDLVSLMATIKGLPSGYNKDLQDDKRALFDAVDTMMLVLPAVAGTLAELRFSPSRMRAAVSSLMMATDLADYLVARGVSFRDAHGSVGQLVRESLESETELDALPFTSFTSAHPAFGPDVKDALSAAASVARRDVPGGTGPKALRAQIEAAHASLRPSWDVARGNALDLRAG